MTTVKYVYWEEEGSWLGYLEDLVCQAMGKGEIEEKTSPSSIASIIIATLEGSLMMSRITNDRIAMTHAREHLHKMLDDVTTKPR